MITLNALAVSFFAALCASVSNLFIRKNSLVSNGPHGHLTCHYLTSFIISFFICKDSLHIPFNGSITSIGAAVGILNVALMGLLYQALNRGPSGLTFALLNASSIFPGVLLFLLFGREFGFDFTMTQAIGMSLVIFGFVIATKTDSKGGFSVKREWLKYALGSFLVQIVALSLIQWRCLLFESHASAHVLLPTTLSEESDVWFMPGLFGAAFLFQAILFLRERRMCTKSELFFGVVTGLAIALSTYFLSLATKLALPQEKALLFPCYAVATIILSNGWASKLYKEKFNVHTNVLCSAGIFVASIF